MLFIMVLQKVESSRLSVKRDKMHDCLIDNDKKTWYSIFGDCSH